MKNTSHVTHRHFALSVLNAAVRAEYWSKVLWISVRTEMEKHMDHFGLNSHR